VLARLATAVWVGLGLLGCGSGGPPSIVLVTVDTLRADHVGAYAGEDRRTPHLDALAREGALFERASAPIPLTRPSHFSILTGLHPRAHGVLDNHTALPDEALTVAEVLAERGWRTAAFTAVGLLAHRSGAAQGFGHFESTGRRRQRGGDEVVEHALAWLGSVGPRERFFLWVHLFEPHLPYAPPPAFQGGLDPALASAHPKLSWDDLEAIARESGGDVPAPILEHALRLYAAEVAAADELVGRLVAGLAARRALDEMLLVVTADHGECFEHGIYFDHSDCLYQGALHVPLLVRHPREFAPGARIAHPASLLDVAPTLLRAAGLQPTADGEGRPLQESATFAERHLLVQQPLYEAGALANRRAWRAGIPSVAGRPTRGILASDWVGLVGPRWKLLAGDGAEELYPTAPHPDESESHAAAAPQALVEMRRRLETELAARPLARREPAAVDEELRETLEALGYHE
jgi:arylsulfatase A-like enzyme